MSTMARTPEAFGAADFTALPVDRHPETLAWIARIEAARSEAALPPLCESCEVAARTQRRRLAMRLTA